MATPATAEGAPPTAADGEVSRPATGFTAVNGRTSPQNGTHSQPPPNDSEKGRKLSEGEAGGSRQQQPLPQQQHQAPPPSHHSSPSPTSRPREPYIPPSSATATATARSPPYLESPSMKPASPKTGGTQQMNGVQPLRESKPSQNGITSPPKRKRSLSDGRRGSVNGPPYSASGTPHSPRSQRPGLDNIASRERDAYGRHPYSSPQESYPPSATDNYQPVPPDSYARRPSDAYPPNPQHAYPPPPADNSANEVYPRSERGPPSRPEYEQSVDPSIAPGQPRPYYSEAHLADALQRENRAHDQNLARAQYSTPEEDDNEGSTQYGEYGHSTDAAAIAEAERRGKRKRIFSNRTKTGCMTCRRRKKKCDEQHPECECIPGMIYVVLIMFVHQVITASVVASRVRVTMLEIPGKNQPITNRPCPFSRKTAIPLHPHQAVVLATLAQMLHVLTHPRITKDLPLHTDLRLMPVELDQSP